MAAMQIVIMSAPKRSLKRKGVGDSGQLGRHNYSALSELGLLQEFRFTESATPPTGAQVIIELGWSNTNEEVILIFIRISPTNHLWRDALDLPGSLVIPMISLIAFRNRPF
jgi:hypothetical protein